MISTTQFHYLGPPIQCSSLLLCRMGTAYTMMPSLIDRPCGTDDFLLMLFYGPVTLSDELGTRQTHGPGIIWWPPHFRHYYGNPAAPWSHAWIHCNGPMAREFTLQVPSNRWTPVHPAPLFDAPFHWLAQQLDYEPHPPLIESLVTHLLCHARECLFATAAAPPMDARLLTGKKMLEAHIGRPISIQTIAAALGISPGYFSIQFRKAFGCSPQQYLTRCRMEAAHWLMRDRNLTLQQIACQVGYDDYPQFAALCRRHFGEGPRRLRQSLAATSSTGSTGDLQPAQGSSRSRE